MSNTGIDLRIRQLIDHFCDGNNSIFARNIGISEANIRNYLNGTMPKFDTLYRIIENFDISCEWLITGKGTMIKSDLPQGITHTEDNDYKALAYKTLMAQEEALTYTKIHTHNEAMCDTEQIVELKDNIIEALKHHIKTLEEQSNDYKNDCDILRQDNKEIRKNILELSKQNISLQQEINRLHNVQ